MSRNKTIKLLHDVTLKSYAECRAALKRNNWDCVTTYYYMHGGINLNEFSKAFSNFAENLSQAMAAACESLAHTFAGVAESMRNSNALSAANKISLEDFEKLEPNNQREILGLEPVTASNINPSEVRASIAADYGESDGTTYAEMRDQDKPLSIGEIREQFGLEPIDVNDPKTPVFAPYYASKAKDGKLYQNNDKDI